VVSPFIYELPKVDRFVTGLVVVSSFGGELGLFDTQTDLA